MKTTEKESEAARLAHLRALRVLDTAPEPLFDALVRAASLVTGAPIALVSLVDAERQWFKSNLGLEEASETPRNVAFCAHAILGEGLMEVPDALLDPRFSENPLVLGEPGIRFYAGAPIQLADGYRMGTLCVIDRQPRELTDLQRNVLSELANAVAEALQQRKLALEKSDAQTLQVEAERALAKEHERHANVIRATQVGTFEWNVITGEVHCNERWAEIIGYQLDDLRPLSIETLLDNTHADDRAMAAERFRRHIRGELPNFDCELRMRHKDGHCIWVRNLGRIVEWTAEGAASIMSGLHIDISERKETDARLRASEKSLDTTGRLAGVGGWEVNLLTNEIFWSDETCRIHEMPVGYRPDMTEALSFYPQESRKAIEEAINTAIEDGVGWDIELPLVTAKGRNIWTHTVGNVEFEDGRACRLVGAFQDITWRKRATLAMEVGERRFRKLFQHSLGLICTHDLEGNLLSVNPAAAESIGYPLPFLMGRDFKEIIPKERHEEFDDYLARIRINKSDSGSFQLIAGDGTLRTWQFHNVLDDEDDEPYVIGHAQDITERELNEKELRELSTRDPLTGCFNRRYLRDIGQRMQHGDLWGCIGIDLDRFKHVNDTYGHQRGDEVLVAMGHFLSRHARESDIVFRVGGDEFLMLVKGADKAKTLEVSKAIEADADNAPIAFTLGCAVRQAGQSLDSALAEADRQLYATRARDRA